MIRPEVLDALLAAGATAEMIVAAVKADAQQEEIRLQEKRVKDAERQRKSRSSRHVTVTPRDRCDTPNDIYSNPDILSPEDDKSSSTPKQKRTRIGSGTSLPDDWVPILTPAAQKIVDGWPPGWLDTQVAAFRDHAADKGRKSKDWQAALRKWLTNADEWGRQKNGNRNDSNGIGRKVDGFTAACREIIDRFPDEPGRAANF